MKKISAILCTALFFCALQTDAYTIEGYSALKNYIENCVSQLFYPNHDQRELRSFIQSLADKIHNQEASWFALWVDYDQAKVYQLAIGETIEFIAREALRYGNHHASSIIRQEVTRKIMSYRELPVGVLSEYIGAPLRQKVARIVPAPKPETHMNLYPSEECCICYSAFDGSIEQIFLVPCGHDLCKYCCKQHFFEYNNRHCPKCRATVNREKLREAIFKKRNVRNYRPSW